MPRAVAHVGLRLFDRGVTHPPASQDVDAVYAHLRAKGVAIEWEDRARTETGAS